MKTQATRKYDAQPKKKYVKRNFHSNANVH